MCDSLIKNYDHTFNFLYLLDFPIYYTYYSAMGKITKANSTKPDFFSDFQFLPLTLCPLPPNPEKELVYWESTHGDMTVKLKADPRYGIPNSRDILVVLWFIKKAVETNQTKLESLSVNDFLSTFKIHPNKDSYLEIKDRILRILNTGWTWTLTDGTLNAGYNLNIAKNWFLHFDPDKAEKSESEGIVPSGKKDYIELSSDFYEMVKAHKIPYNIETIKKIKGTPTAINLYLWLNYRSYLVYNSHKKSGAPNQVFIPLFGNKGLKTQLSSNQENKGFKRDLIKRWLPLIKSAWPKCPAFFEEEKDPRLMGKSKRKVFKDGLSIRIDSIDQLDIGPDQYIEYGRAIREAQERDALNSPGCPICSSTLVFKDGLNSKNGKYPDYYRCENCKKNFSKSKFPELFN